ncbi:TPA: hypothetical protein JLI98_003933 [Escherichia coli]|nr:hypothetical protein [Escherichia coli]
MGGKPAARQGDMTRKGLDIVQGSAGVLIGAPTGVACSVCPGGITRMNSRLRRWRATSMTRWAAGRENGYGGGSVT